MKLRNSIRGQATKFSFAFHGALEHDAWGIHERSNTKKCAWPPTSSAKSWRPSKEILCLTFHGVPKHKAWEFHERPSNKICLGLSWSSWAWCLRDPWGVEHFFLRSVAPWNILTHDKHKLFCTRPPTFGLQFSTSNFRPPKICFSPSTSFQTWSLKAPRHAQKIQERSRQIFLPWPNWCAT